MGESGEIHDFHECLKRSHEYEDMPWWEEVYKKAFAGFKSMTSVRQDGWAQRGGIDRIIVLASGKVLKVDEKVREKNYGDILLERWSDMRRQTPGWVQKDLACDYIAYAVAPKKTCFLLPFQQLRMAWLNHGRGWIIRAESTDDLDLDYRMIEAKNNGYVTQSVAVPIKTLYDCIGEAMRIEWA